MLWTFLLIALLFAIAAILWLRYRKEQEWLRELTYLSRHEPHAETLSDIQNTESESVAAPKALYGAAPNLNNARENYLLSEEAKEVYNRAVKQKYGSKPNSGQNRQDENDFSELPIFAAAMKNEKLSESTAATLEVPFQEARTNPSDFPTGKAIGIAPYVHHTTVDKSVYYPSSPDVPKKADYPQPSSRFTGAGFDGQKVCGGHEGSHAGTPEVISEESIRSNLFHQRSLHRRQASVPEAVPTQQPQTIGENEVLANLRKTDSPINRRIARNTDASIHKSVIPNEARVQSHPTEPLSIRFTPFTAATISFSQKSGADAGNRTKHQIEADKPLSAGQNNERSD